VVVLLGQMAFFLHEDALELVLGRQEAVEFDEQQFQVRNPPVFKIDEVRSLPKRWLLDIVAPHDGTT
jgi:hypothetical protein